MFGPESRALQEGDAPSVSALMATMAELSGPHTRCLISFECRDDSLRAQLLQAGRARFQRVMCPLRQPELGCSSVLTAWCSHWHAHDFDPIPILSLQATQLEGTDKCMTWMSCQHPICMSRGGLIMGHSDSKRGPAVAGAEGGRFPVARGPAGGVGRGVQLFSCLGRVF